MVDPSFSDSLKLVLIVATYGSFYWAGAEAAIKRCYVCTDNNVGCLSSDPGVLTPYRRDCKVEASATYPYSSQCAVILGQKFSALYNGTGQRPGDESEIHQPIAAREL